MVAMELILAASEAMMAATSAAKTRPSRPGGSSFSISGEAWSGLARCGASVTAARPGTTTITGISSFR